MRFENRADAGRRLAARVSELQLNDPVVLGIPRGGVPVAFEVAQALGAPLDVILVRKIGVPFQPELAMGAIGEDGVRVVDDEVVRQAGVGGADFAAVESRERAELARRVQRFRGDRERVPLVGRTVVIVDDGIATGSTVRAACQVARAHGAGYIIVAAPIAPPDTMARLQLDADEVIVLASPSRFGAIGQFYDEFSATPDDEVSACLERSRARGLGPGPSGARTDRRQEVTIRSGSAQLVGDLRMPPDARSVVVFAHGSGSSRRSPRNRFVADVLDRAGLGTLLFDLLTPVEAAERANVFDIEMLAGRLGEVTNWVQHRFADPAIAIGYFGASTGAAAALWAAGAPRATVSAVVSRGGRPDLAGPRLAAVRAPTLLIVGGDDGVVVDLNRRARAQMRCETALSVIPGASHLFEEPGTLERAADLARDWFVDHLPT